MLLGQVHLPAVMTAALLTAALAEVINKLTIFLPLGMFSFYFCSLLQARGVRGSKKGQNLLRGESAQEGELSALSDQHSLQYRTTASC